MPGKLAETKNLPTGAKGGLVDQKHREAMGEAVWLFLWALHRQTDDGDGQLGNVLHGRPITWKLISEDSKGFPVRTIQRWMRVLTDNGYLAFASQPGTAGFVLRVCKPKKFAGTRAKLVEAAPNLAGGFAKDGAEGPPGRAKLGGVNTRETTKAKSKTKTSAQPALLATPLPDWIPLDAWADYVKMRRAIRKPLTEGAVDLAIRRLMELKAEGYEPRAVLEQSILNSWQGLFGLKGGGNGAAERGKPAGTFGQQRSANVASALEAVVGSVEAANGARGGSLGAGAQPAGVRRLQERNG